MDNGISRVVVVGGGSAGWLAAGVIAAEHLIDPKADQGFELLLIESPDIPTIGVGEGTWPSMRATLKRIGLSETDFIRECDASFKQGTHFRDWHSGSGDTYSHPFTVPADYADTNLVPHWLALPDAPPFADAVTPQTALFADCLAPKQITTPEYAFVVNYGYHLDAGKFAALLRQHCTERLGVKHIKANVTQINSAENGDIRSVTTDCAGDIAGDLFAPGFQYPSRGACSTFGVATMRLYLLLYFLASSGCAGNIATSIPQSDASKITSHKGNCEESQWVTSQYEHFMTKYPLALKTDAEQISLYAHESLRQLAEEFQAYGGIELIEPLKIEFVIYAVSNK